MVNDQTVRDVAGTYGIELDEEAVHEYVEAVADHERWLSDLEHDLPHADRATNVTEGSDEYGAFRYECSIEGNRGALSGLDVAVKDNIAVAGVPMTCGSTAVSFTPSYHATVVQRLLQAGANLVGTTNMDEFAYFATGEACAHGTVTNPTTPNYVPGGSSSGSGAAVAADLVDVALGSDTGGSIRIPAAFCGTVGLKPTHRAVPRFGFADLAPSLDHIGPLANSVEDAARVFDVIAGPDLRDPSTRYTHQSPNTVESLSDPVEGLSVAVVTDALSDADDPIVDRIEATLTSLEHEGVLPTETGIPGYDQAPTAISIITGIEFATLVANDGQGFGIGTGYSAEWREAVASLRSRGGYGEIVEDRLVEYGTLTRASGGDRYVAARNFEVGFIEAVNAAFEEYDALVTPTMPVVAPEYGEVSTGAERFRLLTNTAPFDLSGHPAISVPCGRVDDRPVGLQIVTEWTNEATALRLAKAAEQTA